jgi:hypothetical protein
MLVVRSYCRLITVVFTSVNYIVAEKREWMARRSKSEAPIKTPKKSTQGARVDKKPKINKPPAVYVAKLLLHCRCLSEKRVLFSGLTRSSNDGITPRGSGSSLRSQTSSPNLIPHVKFLLLVVCLLVLICNVIFVA